MSIPQDNAYAVISARLDKQDIELVNRPESGFNDQGGNGSFAVPESTSLI